MSDLQESYGPAYAFTQPSIDIGCVVHDGAVHADLPVRVPLAMMNRHGLIAGSTGTGKTRTLQLLAEGLSRAGVPVFVSDVKGDLSGLAKEGPAGEKVIARMKGMGREFRGEAFPVEFFSLTGARGTQLRATVSSFGPILLGKVLDLTDTQQSVLAMVFKYCDDKKLPLLDFKDLREVLNYLGNEGKAEAKTYGGMSPATVGVLIRKMVELEQQGAEKYFGEPELEINDLMRLDPSGRGIINILSLADIQDKPRLYSTFLMWLLGQFYYDLPEVGDPEKPRLVFFFDEAHLLFNDASSALVEHIEQIARLIRSKGIGVFFITQTPKDVSNDVLAQLGNRVQHAVRAFTPQDAKNLKATASTFPKSQHFDVDETLTSLGTGEALVTVLNPKGVPTEVAAAQILAPASSMAQLTPEEYAAALARSQVALKYTNPVDRESAHEILTRKLEALRAQEAEIAAAEQRREMEERAYRSSSTGTARRGRREKSLTEQVLGSSAARQATRTVVQQVVRGLFGLLARKR
jgi:hypothetical protein